MGVLCPCPSWTRAMAAWPPLQLVPGRLRYSPPVAAIPAPAPAPARAAPQPSPSSSSRTSRTPWPPPPRIPKSEPFFSGFSTLIRDPHGKESIPTRIKPSRTLSRPNFKRNGSRSNLTRRQPYPERPASYKSL
ncbi:hypothetical protein BRADI_2g23331v3 [Brachypodium distachyon]|uniref:Uncharacterized protein n=1 Tax=Brachypodium distachyon TaxID=15368 RepID=A0A0Q3G3M8_BRADI|nr:hypothetical protein BRADI_2g23331v3 [Brachypodium distachyon]